MVRQEILLVLMIGISWVMCPSLASIDSVSMIGLTGSRGKWLSREQESLTENMEFNHHRMNYIWNNFERFHHKLESSGGIVKSQFTFEANEFSKKPLLQESVKLPRK